MELEGDEVLRGEDAKSLLPNLLTRLLKNEDERSPDSPGQKEERWSLNCCIFNAPERLFHTDTREELCPQTVSIGPCYYGALSCHTMEKYKWQYLRSLNRRMTTTTATTSESNMHLVDEAAIKQLEESAAEYYSFSLDSEDFSRMLIDGIFVLELLRKDNGVVTPEVDDLILTKSWVVPFLTRDLLILVNQLPFFLLQRLFDLTIVTPQENDVSLAELVCFFFDKYMLKPMEIVDRHPKDPKHLLDFLRSSFLPSNLQTITAEEIPMHREILQPHEKAKLIPCATKLRMAGIKFKPAKNVNNLLEFRNGVLEIMPIAIDQSIASFLLNCIVFEQGYSNSSCYFSTYVVLMDLLIDTPKDVAILRDKRIINNYSMTDEELAHFFNTFRNVNTVKSSLSKELRKINKYYRKFWVELRTSFMDTHCSSLWVFLSASAAIVFLLCTLAQTSFTVLRYIQHR